MPHHHRVENQDPFQPSDQGRQGFQNHQSPFGDIFGQPGGNAEGHQLRHGHQPREHHQYGQHQQYDGQRHHGEGQHHGRGQHHGTEYRHHEGGRNRSGHHGHLPDLHITGGDERHHGRHQDSRHHDGRQHEGRYHEGRRHEGRRQRYRNDDQADVQAQPERQQGFFGSWGNPGGGANSSIAQAAENSVGHRTYLPRSGSEYYRSGVPAGLGCTSASTNMFFDGLKAAGKVSDRDYGRLHQIGNDAAYSNLQRMGVAHPVSGNQLKAGDWAYFKTPGHKHGHSGVLFQGDNGQMMVANNHNGRTIATPLSEMERRYRTVRGLRAN